MIFFMNVLNGLYRQSNFAHYLIVSVCEVCVEHLVFRAHSSSTRVFVFSTEALVMLRYLDWVAAEAACHM